MIIGIGIDMIEIARVEQSAKKIDWINRVFTLKEQQELSSRNWNKATIAGRFSAKEAISKALHMSLQMNHFHQMEIFRNPDEAPRIFLNGSLKQHMESLNGRFWHLSISHDLERAIAIAVLEDNNGN